MESLDVAHAIWVMSSIESQNVSLEAVYVIF